jgi:hypothetical protein
MVAKLRCLRPVLRGPIWLAHLVCVPCGDCVLRLRFASLQMPDNDEGKLDEWLSGEDGDQLLLSLFLPATRSRGFLVPIEFLRARMGTRPRPSAPEADK